MTTSFELFLDGLDFGEGPRWHDGRLWYSDFHQHSIYTVTTDGRREAAHADLPDEPSGLGWLPDGTLLVVFMTTRRVMRDDGGTLVEHADLSQIVSERCNDMVVAPNGNAYVGNFGFDLHGGEPFTPADLILVRPDGSSQIAASEMHFPNGSVITPDGRTLIVGQSFGEDYVAFTIDEDGTLSDRRQWAPVPGSSPDGCCLDTAGGIWFASPRGGRVVRVLEGGEVTHQLRTPMRPFACMLGGDDGRTLYVVCAPDSHPDVVAGKALGVIYTTRVEHPHAGSP